MPDLLLDTCAMIWTGNGDAIDPAAEEVINGAFREGDEVRVSACSAWELGLLVARNRLRLTVAPERWFADYVSSGGVVVAAPTPETLIAASFLPGTPPRDPADRIVIATARADDLTIVTRDRLILGYANQGHVRALRC